MEVKFGFWNKYKNKMKVAIASDHAGFELKEKIKIFFSNKIQIFDLGTNSNDSVDYPDFAFELSKEIANKKFDFGVLICGSGIGMSIVANKINGIRAAVCTNTELAKLSRLHNNANILCIGARFTTFEEAKNMIEIFLNTTFEEGRHTRRVEKIHSLTNC